MGEIILFVGFLGFVVWLFRHLRKREIEAFMEADLSMFAEFASGHEDLKELPVTGHVAATASNVVSLRTARSERQPETRFAARDGLFDEIHRNFLITLEKVLDSQFRVFVHLPLGDFLRVESGAVDLRNKSVSFLVCERSHLRVVCGIMLQGTSPSEASYFKFLDQAFRQIGRPLISFPVLASYLPAEISHKISEALNASKLSRTCPDCGGDMIKRKAIKGVNAGKTFWVCKRFPDCKGIERVGRW